MLFADTLCLLIFPKCTSFLQQQTKYPVEVKGHWNASARNPCTKASPLENIPYQFRGYCSIISARYVAAKQYIPHDSTYDNTLWAFKDHRSWWNKNSKTCETRRNFMELLSIIVYLEQLFVHKISVKTLIFENIFFTLIVSYLFKIERDFYFILRITSLSTKYIINLRKPNDFLT